MDRLQQLLDERWPLNNNLASGDFINRTAIRGAFTEGYNARIAEEKEDHLLDMPTPGYNRKDLVEECFRLKKVGQEKAAISLYRKATGCSNGWAKFVLSI